MKSVILGRAHFYGHKFGYFTYFYVPEEVPWDLPHGVKTSRSKLVVFGVDVTHASKEWLEAIALHCATSQTTQAIENTLATSTTSSTGVTSVTGIAQTVDSPETAETSEATGDSLSTVTTEMTEITQAIRDFPW